MKIRKRRHVINYIIKNRDYRSYLEIGIRDPAGNFDRIKCEYKIGIDPDLSIECNYHMTSDRYFEVEASDGKKFDLIFIDGLHEWEQVLRDVDNSLEHLSDGGTIVMHDCDPHSSKQDTTTVWKAFSILRMTRPDLSMYVVDVNQGCGVVRKGEQTLFDKFPIEKLNYKKFKKFKKEILKPVTTQQFKKVERI